MNARSALIDRRGARLIPLGKVALLRIGADKQKTAQLHIIASTSSGLGKRKCHTESASCSRRTKVETRDYRYKAPSVCSAMRARGLAAQRVAGELIGSKRFSAIHRRRSASLVGRDRSDPISVGARAEHSAYDRQLCVYEAESFRFLGQTDAWVFIMQRTQRLLAS